MKNFRQILCFALLPCLVCSQPTSVSLEYETPNFTRYTMADGLPDNWAHVALRDRYGFLWFGTEGGLTRFDGKDFLNFYEQKDNPTALSCNSVQDICEDPDGTFWIAVLDGGLNHFDPATGQFESWKTDPGCPEMKGQALSLLSIHQDGDLLWLGSYHHGLGCFDKKKRRFTGWRTICDDSLLQANSFQFNTVKHIVADRHDPRFLWTAAAGRGLARFEKNTRTFHYIDIQDEQIGPGAAAMKILQDDQGKVWIASWSAGVACYDPSNQQLKTYPYDVSSWKKRDVNRNVALAVLEKNDNELWVATQDNGFGIFEKKSGKYRFLSNPLSGDSPELDRHCQGLYLDPSQRLWVLGVQGGIRSFDFQNESFRYVSLASHNDKTEQAVVADFAHDPLRKVVFVATENSGCFEWSSRIAQRAKPLPGGQYPSFRAVLCDAKGNVWAGAVKTLGGEASLYLLRPGRAFFEPVPIAIGVPLSPARKLEETVNDIFEDSKGNIWVATSYDGLYKISPGLREAKRYSTETGFVNWWVFMEVEEDRRGHLWLALKSNGVVDFDPETGSFVKYDDQNTALSKNIRSLETDVDGSTWLGTNSKGLQVITPGEAKPSVRTFGKKDGLLGDHVSGIEKDDAGHFWVATDKGLAMYDPARKKFKAFAKAEGLQDPYLFGKGMSFFAGLGVLVGQPNGFCLLRQAAHPVQNAAPIKVALTDFRVFDESEYFKRSIRNTQEIVLKPSENVFSFAFAAPASFNSDLTAYQFRLDGFDEDWYTTDERKSITYTSLRPGRYVFRVRANLSDDRNSPETTLKICLLPHWWQAWWFRFLAVAAVVAAALGLYKYRTRQLKREMAMQRQMAELERSALQAQMNPHFIFNCLNSIQNFILQNEKNAAIGYLGRFAKLIRGTLNASVAGRVTLEEELQLLDNYLELEKLRFKNRFVYEVKTAAGVDIFETTIPPLLVQPYVENAVLHGIAERNEGGKVNVFFEKNNDELVVTVTDNGIGFQPDNGSKTNPKPHKSFGMTITRSRLELLSNRKDGSAVGTVTLRDEKGQVTGTQVTIRIGLMEQSAS